MQRLSGADPRSHNMRISHTLLLGAALSYAHAQGPRITDILAMRDCLDTACISEHARPLGFCPMGGIDEDGYLWFSCEDARTRNWKGAERATIGFWFHGDGGSHYSIVTNDTAYAQDLTDELVRLGFHPPERPVPVSPFRYTPYRNSDYRDVIIRLDEVRWRSGEIDRLTYRFKVIKRHS